jgi:hypothetical protein
VTDESGITSYRSRRASLVRTTFAYDAAAGQPQVRLAGAMMIVKGALTLAMFRVYSGHVEGFAYSAIVMWLVFGASLLPDLTRYHSRRLAMVFLALAIFTYGKNLVINTAAGGTIGLAASLPDFVAAVGVLVLLVGRARRLRVICCSVVFVFCAACFIGTIVYNTAHRLPG